MDGNFLDADGIIDGLGGGVEGKPPILRKRRVL